MRTEFAVYETTNASITGDEGGVSESTRVEHYAMEMENQKEAQGQGERDAKDELNDLWMFYKR